MNVIEDMYEEPNTRVRTLGGKTEDFKEVNGRLEEKRISLLPGNQTGDLVRQKMSRPQSNFMFFFY